MFSYMGLPEFGVINSADSTIFHDMLMEPAHNHIGDFLPVPYDQLVPGMYTTQEYAAEPDQAAAAVAAFNSEVATAAIWRRRRHETDRLMNLAPQSLTMTTMNFTTVPSDAPQLQAGLEEFENQLKTNANELRNGWGAVIITEPQKDLKRVDVIITWDEVQIENGQSGTGRERQFDPGDGRERQSNSPDQQPSTSISTVMHNTLTAPGA